jgi:MFS family permease
VHQNPFYLHNEARRVDPLLELRFFRSVPFSGATVTARWPGSCGYGSFLFLNALYLQNIRGLSALRARLYMLPVAVLVVLLAPIAARIVGQIGPRVPMVIAGTAMAASGLLALTFLTPTTPVIALLSIYLLVGVGQGMINPPITNSAVSGMPASMAGVAASVASTSRQTGMTLGVAVSGSIVGSTLAEGGIAFTTATHAISWLLFALGLLVVGLGLLTTGRWALGTARLAALKTVVRLSLHTKVAVAKGAW